MGFILRLIPWGPIKKALIVLALAAALVAVLTAGTAQGRTGVRAALLLTQLSPGFPVQPQSWFALEPTRTDVTYSLSGGETTAHLYVPGGDGPFAAVLLVPGVNPAGQNDERIVNLATGLARAGMVVMVPWTDPDKEMIVRAEEVGEVVETFQHMQRFESVDPERSGLGGFCIGGSIAAVAAQDPRLRESVAFVNFFGGYYDAEDLLAAIASETRFYEGADEPWDPRSLSREVFTNHVLSTVSDAADRDLLTKRFANGNSFLAIDRDSLTPEGQNAFDLLSGPDLEEADRLLDDLPPDFQSFMQSVSPSTNLELLTTRVLIMHDRQDRYVPAAESRRMAAALEELDGDVYFSEYEFFDHLDPTRSVGPFKFVGEAFKLNLHLYNILRAAD